MFWEGILEKVYRLTQVSFAAIIMGTCWVFLRSQNLDKSLRARVEYTGAMAIFETLFALVRLRLPQKYNFRSWFLDFMPMVWLSVALGLLADSLDGMQCGYAFDWTNMSPWGSQCDKFKAILAFTFLAIILWVVSALYGLMRKRLHEARVAQAEAHRNNSWETIPLEDNV